MNGMTDMDEILGPDRESTEWHHDLGDVSCDFHEVGPSRPEARCRLCREDVLPTQGVHTFDAPPDEDLAVARESIVQVRMNTDGALMSPEYAVGLLIQGDAHEMEVISQPITDRSEVERAIATLSADPGGDPRVEHVLLTRFVSDWEDERQRADPFAGEDVW